jgi:hypothetical protein
MRDLARQHPAARSKLTDGPISFGQVGVKNRGIRAKNKRTSHQLDRVLIVPLLVKKNLIIAAMHAWSARETCRHISPAALTYDLARQTDHREAPVQTVKELSPGDFDMCVHSGLFGVRDVNLVVNARNRRRLAAADICNHALGRFFEKLDLCHCFPLLRQIARSTVALNGG